MAAVFFTPFWSNAAYRDVFGSGNMAGFLSPFPLHDLTELKEALDDLPDGYVDPAANPEQANLTSDELLALAAADVQDLEPPPGGVVGSSQLGVGLTVALLVASVLLVRWRARLHPDDEPDGPGPDDGPDARTHHDDTDPDQEAP